MKLMRLALIAVSLMVACSSSNPTGSDLEDRVNELVSQMTLDEKVAQMSGEGTPLVSQWRDKLWSVPGVERGSTYRPFRMSDGPERRNQRGRGYHVSRRDGPCSNLGPRNRAASRCRHGA